jgi:Ca2+-binding EF-hand superfamily protein
MIIDLILANPEEYLAKNGSNMSNIFSRVIARNLGLNLEDQNLTDILKRADEMQSGKVRYEQLIEICHKQMVIMMFLIYLG